MADFPRRAAVSERAAERYRDALSGVDEHSTVQELLVRLGRPRDWNGRRVRPLDPLGQDRALLEAAYRYQLTDKGQRAVGAVLAALRAAVRDLLAKAA